MRRSTINPSLDEFVKDVENHQMQVLVDDDLHRSLLFKQPNTGNQYFRINTWPHHLCISGDMGTFVFSRIPDMFEFFRGDKEPNLGYWSEKLEAGKAQEHSESQAREVILKQAEDAGLEPEDLEYAKLRIDRMELDSEFGFYNEVMNWSEHELGFSIDTDGIGCCKEYTYHFTWCCRAIIWAIQQYDALKTKDGAA